MQTSQRHPPSREFLGVGVGAGAGAGAGTGVAAGVRAGVAAGVRIGVEVVVRDDAVLEETDDEIDLAVLVVFVLAMDSEHWEFVGEAGRSNSDRPLLKGITGLTSPCILGE